MPLKITRRNAVVNTLGTWAAFAQDTADEGQQFFLRLTKANDEAVGRMLQQSAAGGGARVGRGQNVAALVAAYCFSGIVLPSIADPHSR